MGEEGGLDRDRGGSDRGRWRGADNVNRRRCQVMQDLADLAAVFVVSELRRGGRAFENWYRETPREGQIVVMPSKQDGLEQKSEQAQLGRQARCATTALAHASRHWLQRPLSTR